MIIEKINKNVLLFIGILAVLVTGFFIVKSFRNVPIEETNLSDTSSQLSDETLLDTTPAKSLSYAEALKLYKDKRIQLDTDCRATPSNVTFKNNTKIMIDNRSDVSRAVKLGSTMTIKPWGFKIVTLTSNTLPATLLLDCGALQNVASILIQK